MKSIFLLLLLNSFLFSEEIQRIDKIPVLIKYVIHDSFTDEWIETIDGPLEVHDYKEWEEKNRKITDNDWATYKNLGYIILYVKTTKDWI